MGAAEVSREVTLEHLRARIARLKASPRQYLAQLRLGLPSLEGLLGGGLPMGQALELHGEPASGRVSLALRAAAAATGQGRLAAYVDGPGELYPPVALALGVHLERFLIVRPRAPGQLVWTALQLLRSGAFTCVVLDLTHTGAQPTWVETKKLTDAAHQSQGVLVLITPPIAPADAPCRLHVRAHAEGLTAQLLRSRLGRAGQEAAISWAELFQAPVLWGEAREAAGAKAGSETEASPAPAFVRKKLHDARNGGGCHVLAYQRPGRDRVLPPLQPVGG
jgi:hypothetical protein